MDVFLAVVREGGLWEDLSRENHALRREILRHEPTERSLAATPERLDLVARAFAEVIDAKSPFTFRHSERVAEVAAAMGEHVGFDAGARRDIMRAGLLHDIGKLGISSRILDKRSHLTNAEFAEIKRHPKLTYAILSRVGPFRKIAWTAANHHERLDGSGYPHKLTAGELDLPSPILAVADIYDALARERPYREAMPQEQVMEILRKERGAQLCPEAVATLEELVSKNAL